MTSKVNFSYDYSKQDLLNLFNSSTKVPSDSYSERSIANLGDQPYELEEIAPFFESFSFMLKDDKACELSKFLTKGAPHINAGNNGLLIFPVNGSLTLNTYSYVTPSKDSTGRPVMNAEMDSAEIALIEQTKTDSVVISSPTAVNGLSTFSLEPTAPDTIVFMLKINRQQSWESVVEFLNNM
jgi:hypothetical protein